MDDEDPYVYKRRFYRKVAIFSAVLICFVFLFGSIRHDEVDLEMLKGNRSGYWGTITATMDWCEENYTVTPYVAEFWNTISNMFYILFSFFGLIFHKDLELRFVAAWWSIILIGAGSAAFHGTLLYTSQMLDELPMMFTTSIILYICLTHNYGKNDKLPAILPIGITAANIAFCFLYYYYPSPTLFQLTWIALVCVCFLLTLNMHFETIKGTDKYVGEWAVWAMLLSGTAWILEQVFCSPTIQWFRLHSIWHCGTAYSSYCTVAGLYYVWCYSIIKKKNVRYRWFGILPVVTFDEETLPGSSKKSK